MTEISASTDIKKSNIEKFDLLWRFYLDATIQFFFFTLNIHDSCIEFTDFWLGPCQNYESVGTNFLSHFTCTVLAN